MFAMYDDDGLNFRNTIDHLYNVQDLSKAHIIKNDLKDRNNEKFKDLYKGKIDKEAKQKYKQVANMDRKVEIYHAEQIMSHNVLIINDSLSIGECYDMMNTNEVRQLLIRSNDKKVNHLKSMVSTRDILKYLINSGGEVDEILKRAITEVSTKNIITTDPISDIRRVAKVMVDFNINAMPVVDSNDNVLGVVSKYDIVSAVSTIPHLQIWA